MDVALSETQRQLRDTVRAFVAARVKPEAAETDRLARFPRALVTEMGRLGLTGCLVPEADGGAGFDAVAAALIVEELSAASATAGAILAAHAWLATWPIVAFGTAAQRACWLPALAAGGVLGCLAGAIRDGAGSSVAAHRDADGYVLDGAARAVTNGAEAGLAIVVAALADGAGLGAFVVETSRPGWTVVRGGEASGLRGAAAVEVGLARLRVPRESLLGREGEGQAVAAATLDGGCIATAAQAVGIARAALEDALAYAQERRAFGQALAEFQGLQWRLADMATAVESARLLTLRAAFLRDRGLRYTKEAAMAQLFATDAAMTLATQAVQMHGGYGYTREFAVERYFRDAAATSVADGGSDRQRLAVADALLRERGS